MHSLFSFSARRVQLPEPGVGNPVSPSGNLPRSKKVGLSQVPGEPQLSVCHVPNRLRQDCLRQTIATQQRGPWYAKSKGSHDWVFRSSIAWLSDSLFTLRGVSYLSTTQNSLPVAGQALLNGIHTRKVPMKGFKVVKYISFPFPKLAWRNCINLQHDEILRKRGGESDLVQFEPPG